MGRSYYPEAQALMMQWATNFNAAVQDMFAGGIVPTEMAAELAARYSAMASAYQLATVPETRTSPRIEAKREAFSDFKKTATQVVRVLQAAPALTNEQRVMLGITVRKTTPTPVPPPSGPPVVSVDSVIVNRFTLRLRDSQDPDRRRKPSGVSSATVLYHVGQSLPASPAGWAILGQTTTTEYVAVVPGDLPAGTRVWFTAYWLNTTAESGPAAPPIHSQIGFGGITAQAA